MEPVRDVLHGAGNLVSCYGGGRSEEGVEIAVAIDGVLCSHAERIVGEEREADFGVVVDPGQALLYVFDLDANHTLDDGAEGIEEDRSVEYRFEAIVHCFQESGERVVDRVCGIDHIAENVVVDVALKVCDDTIGVAGPAIRDAADAFNNLTCELAHLLGNSRNLAPDGLQEDGLNKAREEAGEGKREDEHCRDRSGVGPAPAGEDLLPAAEARRHLDAPGGRHGAGRNIDDVH